MPNTERSSPRGFELEEAGDVEGSGSFELWELGESEGPLDAGVDEFVFEVGFFEEDGDALDGAGGGDADLDVDIASELGFLFEAIFVALIDFAFADIVDVPGAAAAEGFVGEAEFLEE